MSDRAKAIEEILRATPMPRSTDEIAWRMGYRPARKGRLAVTSSLRAMERRGDVFRLPPRDRWSIPYWGMNK